MHVSLESPVADHCMVHALSDSSEACFKRNCQHTHEENCSQCDELRTVLAEINEFVQQASFDSEDDRDEAVYVTKHSTEMIQLWKAHQLRSVRQDESRQQILQQLDTGSVLITQDWAMKFLPRKYRESQADWFGKRGISWHISVAVRRDNNHHLQSQGFVHIIQNCSQGSKAVVSIMEHVLVTLKKEHPEIVKAHFRQDNAGCYHSAVTIASVPAIAIESGIVIADTDFSEPQGGKGPADRMAATIKGHITRYINEGNDVTNAQEMEKAILSHGGLQGIRVCVVDFLGETADSGPTPKITGISRLNNFKFLPGGVQVWQAFGIGPGKCIRLDGENGMFTPQ